MSAAPPELPGLAYAGVLGRGGYADVYAYEQALPRRRVAVKVLRDAAAAAAFVAEADALARLEHPHIVPLYAAGLSPDGRGYLVLPLLPGPSLGERCRARPLGVGEVLRVGVQVAGALETAHRHGLLHRDVKPANLLTGGHGVPLLADFGLAGRPADADGADLGVSVPWAAPELLFDGAPATAASEVYALAATLWTLLAGRAPHERPGDPADNVARLLRRVRATPAEALGCPGAPPQLDAVLRRALATDPAARPGSAAELAGLLAGAQRALGEQVTRPVVLGPAGGAPATTTRLLDPSPAAALAAARAWPPPAASPAPPVSPPAPEASGVAPAVGPVAAEVPRRVPRRRPRVLVAAALLGLAAAVGWLWGTGAAGPTPSLTAARTGARVAFAWSYPDPRPGDAFEVEVGGRLVVRAEPRLVVDAAARACLRVRVLDAAGRPRGPFSGAVCA